MLKHLTILASLLALISCSEQEEGYTELLPPNHEQDSLTESAPDESWKTVILPSDIELDAMDREPVMRLIQTAMNCIRNNDYDTWKGLMSDTTIAITPEAQLRQRLKRLHEYAISWEFTEVIRFETFEDSLVRENGITYHAFVKVPEGAQVVDRVSFDPVKVLVASDPALESTIGLNIVSGEDGFQLFQHKYIAAGSGAHQNQ